ncbi:hypothetical protein [Lacipirellula parvula]|uniref:Tse2 ADP-ribosyltransferase toxin domain-containing protein n=1 Tax=Lacipirellula parvula TaxID=2650471 RepID=A0A5K7XJL7_9BACT|nr:hypothetical protein [Lacipirellula parvula]BBO34423.1 hypothetical protein PLANPX_4035 [Lacipirellula parvula]
MPLMFRTMKKEDDNHPAVDYSGKGLGVRGAAVNGQTDISTDASGMVILDGSGMSVAPSWRELPFFLIPKRLIEHAPAARGSQSLHCFRMGDGQFIDSPIAAGLELKVDKPLHGNITPEEPVTLQQFQQDLANTRGQWTIDES